MSMGAKSTERIDPQRWGKIKGIFQSAFEMDPAEQSAFLDEACSGDASLRKSVESLLSSDEQEWDLLDRPAFEAAAGLLAEDQPELSEGETVGYYKILGLLGAGGMGEVYLAEDIRLGRKIALKILPTGLIGSEARLQRFRQEARTASTLNHPNIVTIHEITEIEGRHFIATEYIEGETLRQRLSRGKMSVGEALDVAIQVGSALSAAHRAGIVHRDIKPENIMLRTDGYAKVLDFGLAKLIEQQVYVSATIDPGEGKPDSSSSLLMGTLKYMSPEQVNRQDIDARSDIFSFGVVLYEMVAGHTPFEGENDHSLANSILKDQPAQLTQYAPEVPEELQRIVSKALGKDRNERYQTITDMLDGLKLLKRVLESGAIVGLPTPSGARDKVERPVAANAGQIAALTDDKVEGATNHVAATRTGPGGGYITGEIKHRKRTALALTVFVVVSAVIGLLWYSRTGKEGKAHFQKVKIRQLTTNGKARDAAISPDGKYVAYVVDDSEQESLWIKQISTNDSQEVVPATGVRYAALTFSPDGKNIYYVKYEMGSARNALYHVAVSGGESKRIIPEVHSPVSFSPDGKQFAFMRRLQRSREKALMIAAADGTEEQELGRRKEPEFFADYPCGPAWSPDGKVIACGAGRVVAGNRFRVRLVEFHVKDKTEKVINDKDFIAFSGLSWLADGSGLIAVSPDCPVTQPVTQTLTSCANALWHIPYPGGEPRIISPESPRVSSFGPAYDGVSINASSDMLVTSAFHALINNSIAPIEDPTRIEQIATDYYYRAWTSDGRIVYSSQESGNEDLWIMDTDGRNRKQLTSGPGLNGWPVPSPDDRYIVFASNRSGANSIWRMDMDGGNQKQLTDIGTCPDVSPDGRWVIYHVPTGEVRTLWKVSIDGGEPEQLTDQDEGWPAISPDGKLIAYHYKGKQTDTDRGIAIMPFEGGPPLKQFDLSVDFNRFSRSRWTPDGRGIMHIRTKGGVSNLWIQPIDGGPPKQMTTFKNNSFEWFDLSPDRRLISYTIYMESYVIILISSIENE